jgi:hypothetical protein
MGDEINSMAAKATNKVIRVRLRSLFIGTTPCVLVMGGKTDLDAAIVGAPLGCIVGGQVTALASGNGLQFINAQLIQCSGNALGTTACQQVVVLLRTRVIGKADNLQWSVLDVGPGMASKIIELLPVFGLKDRYIEWKT